MHSDTLIRLFYRHFLGRSPDPPGFASFMNHLEQGTDLREIIRMFVESEEYHRREAALVPQVIDFSPLQHRPIVIVDVGAQKLEGEDHIYTPILTSGLDWRCIGFEPLKHRLASRREAEPDPRIRLLDAFIGDGSARTFYTNNEDATSSLLPLALETNAAFTGLRQLRSVKTTEVETSRLDDILAHEPHIDLLKLDIQGFELEALRGAKDTLRRTNLIHCEVSFFPMYIGSALFADIDRFLREQGFEFLDFVHLSRYAYADLDPGEDRLIWGDAVFFRKLAAGPSEVEAAFAQAALATLIFGKYGFASHVARTAGTAALAALFERSPADSPAPSGTQPSAPASQSLETLSLDPLVRDPRFRIEMTASCRDCDSIPKVANAGAILDSSGRRAQVMHNGVLVVAGGYHGEWMAEVISRLRGHHEPQEELVFHTVLAHIPLEATMIELGGFWSYYSLWFLQQAPSMRRAVVLEPDAAHLLIGRANAELNSRDLTFVHASAGIGSLPPQPFQTELSGTALVPQTCVEDLMSHAGLDVLDVLHCDTQGAEIDVIRSCEDLFRQHRIRFCLISTHHMSISGDPLTHQRCLALLRHYGGRILAEHDVHESFSGDGLIAAYFGEEPLDWQEPAISRNRYSTSLFANPLFDLAALV